MPLGRAQDRERASLAFPAAPGPCGIAGNGAQTDPARPSIQLNSPARPQMLEGNRGLLFTDEPPEVVTEWFESFKKQDFARTGNTVDEGFELPAGASGGGS